MTKNAITGGRRAASKRTPRCDLAVEVLEDRVVPASISVAGATINEIGSPSAFVTAGSGGLSSPFGITTGPDGNVYVAGDGGAVLRYNGTTGAYINTFVSQGSDGLAFGSNAGLAFGPDGNLYVTSQSTNQVLKYNGSTGAFIEAFVSAGSGGLSNPRSLTFGPDGNLYVSSANTNSLLRFEGPLASSPGTPLPASGQSGATFVAPSSGGLVQPFNAIFGPDGNLYVDGGQTAGILRYNGTTGAFMNTFAGGGVGGVWVYGRGMAFDQDGNLYVGDSSNAVHRYDTQGNSLGDLLVNSVNPSLSKPFGLTFNAQGDLLITCRDSNSVVQYNSGVDVSLSAASSTPVSVNYTTEDGSALAGTNYYGLSGTVTFAPGQTSQMILLATQEDPQATGTVSFSVQLSNPTGGATIASGTATVNVAVADSTRQFSIANTSAIEGDATAHYRGAFVQGLPDSGFGSMTMGPDGNLYVTTGPGGMSGNGITSYNGTTGALIGIFIPPVNGQIEATGRVALALNAGYLYVGSPGNNEVLQYNRITGAFVSVFISSVTPNSLAIGPDANGDSNDSNADLYVSTSSGVSRYNAATGAYLGTYITNGSGGLSNAGAMTFNPSQTYLYVASTGTNEILDYNALTGAYVGVAASSGVSDPVDVKFGPNDGLLYVLSAGNNRILRYTATGTYVDDYVPAGSGGMVNPYQMVLGPYGDLYVSATGSPTDPDDSQIFDFGAENEAVFTVMNTTPSTLPLTVNYATADGTAIAGTNYTATSGTLTFAPGWTTATIDVPVLDSGTLTTSLTFTLNLSNPVGATISNGQGIGTILPSDTTVTSDPAGPIIQGESVDFTAEISGSPNVGTVSFYFDYGQPDQFQIGGAVNVSNGSATSVSTSALPAGSDTITAIYSGGAGFAGSQGTLTIQVTSAAPPSITSVVINQDISALYNAAGQASPGVQRSMVDDVVYTFSEPVNILSPAVDPNVFAIAVASGWTGTVPTLGWAPIAGSGNTEWAVTFSGDGVTGGSIANGAYTITVTDPASITAVSDSQALSLAGSGIGGATQSFFRLFGDINGDEVVNAADNLKFKQALTTYNAAFDYNDDGAVNASDNLKFKDDLSVNFSGFTATI